MCEQVVKEGTWQVVVVDESGEEMQAGWQDFARRALARVLEEPPGPGDCVLQELHEVVIAMVGDERMAELHKEFSGVPGPTDVLTFQHGEIVLSIETARSYASDHGIAENEEIARYIVHGLLHLHGYEDGNADSHQHMHTTQEKIMAHIQLP